MRKAFIYSFLVLVVLILVWCSGYFYGVLSNERIGINEIRADIQRASENESRAIKQLDSTQQDLNQAKQKLEKYQKDLLKLAEELQIAKCESLTAKILLEQNQVLLKKAQESLNVLRKEVRKLKIKLWFYRIITSYFVVKEVT